MTETQTRTPRVWIGCLAAYNEGTLHGAWVDVPDTVEELAAEVDKVIRSSPADYPEEWFFADNEGFCPWSVGEWPSWEKLVLAAQLIREHGGAAAGWLANDDTPLDNAGDYHDLDSLFCEARVGQYEKDEDYAYELVSNIGLPNLGTFTVETGPSWQHKEKPWDEVLSDLSPYLDWDALADWAMQDVFVVEVDGDRHHFRSDS